MGEDGQSELADALDQFDRAEANLTKLDDVWHEYWRLVPRDVAFGRDSIRSNELIHAFTDLVANLPAIDGYRIEATPWELEAIAQARFEAQEIESEAPEARLEVERGIKRPGRQLDEYRLRLHRARARLVRDRCLDVIAKIDAVLRDAEPIDAHRARWRGADRWAELGSLVSELDRLVGNTVPSHARWGYLHRHLRFAQSGDLWDIVEMDWPSVRAEVDGSLYDDLEPIPVSADDLGELANARPKGPVSTTLDWSVLTDEDFERLIFELVRQAEGYENAKVLMPTNAPDRGRDIEVYRVVNDPLGGAIRSRVIIQCKHWPGRSVGRNDLVQCAEAVKLWEPPVIDVLVVATSGRFSQDAVALIEKRQRERTLPLVEPWPDSHLETLLSRRPSIAASFGLR